MENVEDRFSNLPEDITTNHIFSRLEMLELSRLRFMSRFFRRIASTEELAQLYNNQDGRRRSCWTFTLLRVFGVVGMIHGCREDGISVSFHVDELIGPYLYPDEVMCGAGSFLLFRIQGEGLYDCSLLVFNICGSTCRRIECPIQFFTEFAFARPQDVKMILNPLNPFQYTIVYVEQMYGGVCYYEYESEEERWTRLGVMADGVDDLLVVGDPREMIMIHHPEVFLVSFNVENNWPVFISPFIGNLVDFHLLQDPNAALVDDEGWELQFECYHSRGRDGLMVVVERYVQQIDMRRSRLHRLTVYRLNGEWNRFELVPDHVVIPQQSFIFNDVTIQETTETIHIGLTNTGQLGWRCILFRFNTITEIWSRAETDWMFCDHLSTPVFSSGLLMPPPN